MSDKTSDKRLLPCPFCGGEAIMNTIEPHKHKIVAFPDYGGGTFVECSSCSCGISADSEDEAIRMWNTRKPMDKIVEQLEEYRDDFMDDIYEELREDADNCRANRIIERFDSAIQIIKEGLK